MACNMHDNHYLGRGDQPYTSRLQRHHHSTRMSDTTVQITGRTRRDRTGMKSLILLLTATVLAAAGVVADITPQHEAGRCAMYGNVCGGTEQSRVTAVDCGVWIVRKLTLSVEKSLFSEKSCRAQQMIKHPSPIVKRGRRSRLCVETTLRLGQYAATWTRSTI